MAYFGRKPKKPGSLPGAASGNTRQDRAVRAVQGAVQRAVDEERPGRPTRVVRVLRAARAIRAGRTAR